jgi:uncharacterized protein RhaS with RHS repeats
LYYYRARYFDSSAGRFLTEDPMGYVGGRNFYVYVGNDTPNLIDPLGLKPCNFPIVPKDPSKRKPAPLPTCPSNDLVTCLIQKESGGNPKAVSPKGAEGSMQVTASAISELQEQSLIGDNYNLDEVGMLYLRLLLSYCDSTTNAIAAYNAGPSAVNKWGGIPPFKETKNYVKRINGCLVKSGHAGGLNDPSTTTCCSKTPAN